MRGTPRSADSPMLGAGAGVAGVSTAFPPRTRTSKLDCKLFAYFDISHEDSNIGIQGKRPERATLGRCQGALAGQEET